MSDKPKGLPPVPSQVFSLLGSLPVDYQILEDDCCGEARFFPLRTVVLLPGMQPEVEWQTYWHEAIHVALRDSGLTNQLNAKVEENICDAIGTYLAAAVRAGFLRVTEDAEQKDQPTK